MWPGRIRSKYRRFKHHNKYERPALVMGIDFLLFALQALMLAGLLGGLLYFSGAL